MHRVINCLGSTNLIAKLVAQKGPSILTAGQAAAHGSAAHDVLARCLTGGEDAWEHLGEMVQADKAFPPFLVDQEMVDGVQIGIDWAREKLAKFPGAILLVERRVASPSDQDAFGTSDIIIVVPGERLIIGDFKYGEGVVCEPHEEQLRAYAQYAFETFVTWGDVLDGPALEAADASGIVRDEIFPDPNTVCELYIIQPRIEHHKGPIRRHVTNRQELARWFYGEVIPAFADSRKADAPLTIGDWCGFCPASEWCPAQHATRNEFNTGIEPVSLTDADLDDALAKIAAINKLKAKLDSELFARAMRGSTFENWKLVRKLGTRVWKPGAEDEIAKVLGADAYSDPQLLTPPALEALKGAKGKLAKDLIAKLAMKPDTGLTMAPMSDKREPQKAPAKTGGMETFDASQGVTQEQAS